MLNFNSRIIVLQKIFDMLQETSSRNEKETIISAIPEEVLDDFIACLEVLDNRIVFGYTCRYVKSTSYTKDFQTIREVFEYLLEPKRNEDLSDYNVNKYCAQIEPWFDFFEPIVNKTLRLGIGKSILSTDIKAPMLAKKFGDIMPDGELYITEKLDGNRCIAWHDGERWHYTSRNGRPMNVEFDMSGLSTDFIYDGEILSEQQTNESRQRHENIINDMTRMSGSTSKAFQSTSGLINRKYEKNKGLTYNIFDIQAEMPYVRRRYFLDNFKPQGENVRIVPLLRIINGEASWNAKYEECAELLDKITSSGGEGIMINIADAEYEHKRTKNLLKFKKSKTMDMLVKGTYLGTGKYENAIGGLFCEAFDLGGTVYCCSVGTGISDEQRFMWHRDPKLIVGKIIEVEYFDVSQSKDMNNTKIFSLRFPRFKQIRKDKSTTSVM